MCATLSEEGDFITEDCNGTVHILNIDNDGQPANTIENAHAVRYLLATASDIMFCSYSLFTTDYN